MKRSLAGAVFCTFCLSGYTAIHAGIIEQSSPTSSQHRGSVWLEQVQPVFSKATTPPVVLATAEMISSSDSQAQIQQLQKKIQELQEERKEDLARQRNHIEQMIELRKSERSTLSSEKYNHDSKSYARSDIERSIRALDSEIYLLQNQRSRLR